MAEVHVVKRNQAVQINLDAREVSFKSVQVNIKEGKARRLNKSVQTDNLNIQESENKKRKLNDSVNILPPDKNKLLVVGGWLDKLKSECKISTFVFYKEKLALNSKDRYLEVTRSDILVPSLGYEPVKFLVNEDGEATMIVAYEGACSRENLFEDDQFMEIKAYNCFKTIFEEGYALCAGVTPEAHEKLSEIKFSPKNITNYESPISRKSSKLCSIWFKPSKFASAKHLNVKSHCNPCRNVSKHIRKLGLQCAKRIYASPSSNCPLKYLSPKTQNKRRSHLRVRKHRLFEANKKLSVKCEEYELQLNAKQSDELFKTTKIIRKDFSNEFEEILNENPEASASLREIWETDCAQQREQDRQDFAEDQSRNCNGKVGNRWSVITYRIALAIACRSRAAYEALKSFAILNLPSWRSLQRKMSKHLDGPGINFDYMQEQQLCYEEFVKEELAVGRKEPKGDGILIFDEVKVTAKVIWNSKNHQLVGLAMTSDELSSLDDIYEDLKPSETLPKANYMLQFLWRDLTSDYDIVGPYFASENTTDTHFIAACLFEVLRAFHLHNFKVSVLMCDGAASNLSLIKQTQGYQGAYGVKISASKEVNIEVNPSFRNPFMLNKFIHWIICPSHEMKSLVNALFSSKEGGARQFVKHGIKFGWDSIIAMKKREDQRREAGIPRFIPDLVQSYIDRDAWTKLNVKPARIMQQNEVLAELFEHANPKNGDKPDDSEETMATFKYLEAVSLLFEKGMLKRGKITSLEDPLMVNMENGLKYFKDWLVDLKARDVKFNMMYPTKAFLAWQTWDLLRVMVFGMKALVKDFTKDYPGYYLAPLRLNGSAVETLFSQYKFNANGKLSGANFAYARKNLQTKAEVHGHHHSSKNYRSERLYVSRNFSKFNQGRVVKRKAIKQSLVKKS